LTRGRAVVRASEEAGGDAPAGIHCEESRGAEGTGPARDCETSLVPSLLAFKFVVHDALDELALHPTNLTEAKPFSPKEIAVS
jgi:hypothetical protein